MKKLFLFAVIVCMSCSISAQDSMFPSIIMNSKINSTDSNNYKNPAYQFHITSIDWDKKIITIDKNIILPNEQNMPNAQYWQMFVLGIDVSTDINNLLQLTNQISPNSFGFTLVLGQDGTIIKNAIKTLEIANAGNNYKDGDILNIINLEGDNNTWIWIHVTKNPYTVTIYELTIDIFKGNFMPNQVYKTYYASDNKSTGDGTLTVKVLTTINILNDEGVLHNNFSIGQTIGFRNPQQAWMPLSLTEITESPKVYPNHFVDYISRYNNQFIALIDYNTGAEPNRFGIVHSDDFINWDHITPITPASIGNLPSWMNPNLLNIGFGMCTNNVNGNVHTLTFNQAYTIPYNNGRAGICTTSDFINYNFSKTYFTCNALADDNTVSWNKVSYCLFKGVYYIIADITNLGQRRCYLFTWGGNTSDMTLKLIQKIGDNKPKYCWNYQFTANPNMFIANNNLYMFIEGVDGILASEYGNVQNCDGLFIFNETTGLFEEYFSNPVILNVELDNDYLDYHQHQDNLAAYQYKNKLYALICMSDQSMSSYKVFPALLYMKNKKMVDDWLNKTTGLK